MKRVLFAGAVAGIVAFGAGFRPVVAQEGGGAPDYVKDVQPILKANCYRCHGGMNHRGGLNFETRAGMLKGGHDGSVLIPGDPAKSLLVRLIRHEGPADDPMPMPPKSKLTDAQIAVVERWVKAGALMPADTPKP